MVKDAFSLSLHLSFFTFSSTSAEEDKFFKTFNNFIHRKEKEIFILFFLILIYSL